DRTPGSARDRAPNSRTCSVVGAEKSVARRRRRPVGSPSPPRRADHLSLGTRSTPMSSTFPVALSGARAQTLMWAHEHDVDHAALNQLRNISALPWVEDVRVMPDVHLGKGATVGSVIAMRDAVSPNAVGVDIG